MCSGIESITSKTDEYVAINRKYTKTDFSSFPMSIGFEPVKLKILALTKNKGKTNCVATLLTEENRVMHIKLKSVP